MHSGLANLWVMEGNGLMHCGLYSANSLTLFACQQKLLYWLVRKQRMKPHSKKFLLCITISVYLFS